jgi:hypothetical protein
LQAASPGGNSGVAVFFLPGNGVNGTLKLALQNSTDGNVLQPVYERNSTSNATVGVSSLLTLNDTACMPVFILGSIRTIRDYTQGPSTLYPEIQNATTFTKSSTGGIILKRTWLDNITQTTLSFEPLSGTKSHINFTAPNTTVFSAGLYNLTTTYTYPQLVPFNQTGLLSPQSQSLFSTNITTTSALSFLSYTTKLLAGGWNYLTYFGRDSAISALLLEPILAQGEGSPMETVISAQLTRLNRTSGQVCHEETIGDYATWTNQQNNVTSTAPGCTYIMLDADFYLQVVMQQYFVNTTTGSERREAFLAQMSLNDFGNGNLTFADLALLNAERVMNLTAAFAATGNQTVENLLHILPGQVVGSWRDSTYGIGGGKIPYDSNTALAPAALRAIGALAKSGMYPSHPEWGTLADQYAQVWEDETLAFFNNTIDTKTAQALVTDYANKTGLSTNVNVTDDVNFFSLSLDGYNNLSTVQVMHTDDCFRLYLLNTTNQTQLSSFLSQISDHILAPFPVGLATDVGLFVANPAYGNNPVYAANWTNSAYHGTVVWSWPMAMMAAGLQRQLGRCNSSAVPAFCTDSTLYAKVKAAYGALWDIIELNSAHLSTEVWSWGYNASGGFEYLDYGQVSATEADIVQLWSLSFLAVTRELNL